jgi:hypothetical protein
MQHLEIAIKDTNAVVKSMTPGARDIPRFIVLDDFDGFAAAKKLGNAVHRGGVDVRFRMMFWLKEKCDVFAVFPSL